MLNEGVTLSVSELNEYARKLMAGDPLLRNLEVTGEISGYKHHYTGHRYFTLKDEHAKVQCVMFRQSAMSLDFQPADGMRVTLKGSASIFERDGSFQVYVNAMRRAGEGDLFARFEALKRKLSAEGLFDPARKREIPAMPRIIGVATSQTGAALRDIIQVARRRNPNIGIVVAPCAVQGESAVAEIVRSIELLNRQGEADVLLVGRGGGSIEDLWAFNEEPVARAIAKSRIPVISCVGHEIDFTIADFVADLRAPTPSAAAELAVPVLSELRGTLDGMLLRMSVALTSGQRMRRLRLEKLAGSMALRQPEQLLIAPRRSKMTLLGTRLEKAMPTALERARQRLSRAEASLRALNPDAVLDRGYAVVETDRGVIGGVGQVAVGDTLHIRMSDGTMRAGVTAIDRRTSKDEENDEL